MNEFARKWEGMSKLERLSVRFDMQREAEGMVSLALRRCSTASQLKAIAKKKVDVAIARAKAE